MFHDKFRCLHFIRVHFPFSTFIPPILHNIHITEGVINVLAKLRHNGQMLQFHEQWVYYSQSQEIIPIIINVTTDSFENKQKLIIL